jgi:hypothetical protein
MLRFRKVSLRGKGARRWCTTCFALFVAHFLCATRRHVFDATVPQSFAQGQRCTKLVRYMLLRSSFPLRNSAAPFDASVPRRFAKGQRCAELVHALCVAHFLCATRRHAFDATVPRRFARGKGSRGCSV